MPFLVKLVFPICDDEITKNTLAITNDGKQDIFGDVTCNLLHRIDENDRKNYNLPAGCCSVTTKVA